MEPLPHTELTTERLLLRPVVADDVPQVVRILNNEAVTDWLESIPRPYSREKGLEFLSFANTSWETGNEYVFAITPLRSESLVGIIGLKQFFGGVGEPGYYLDPACWGKGFMSEAVQSLLQWGFKDLSNERMQARHLKGNDASARVLLKSGFEYTGKTEKAHSVAMGRDVCRLWMELKRERFLA